MKTLHVFHHSDLVNGVDRTTLTLLRALREAGNDVHAMVPELGHVTAALDELGVAYRVSTLGCCRGPARAAELAFLARVAQRTGEIEAWIRETGAELVHLNTGHLLDAAIAAARAGVPAVWHIHAPFYIDLQRYERFMPPAGYGWLLGQLGQHVIAVSDDVRDSLTAHLHPAQVTTLYNGIDVDDIDQRAALPSPSLRAELGFEERDPVVFGVGRISAQKDFATFVRVARRVVDELPNARFSIIGPVEDRALADALPTQIRDLGLERHVFLLGPRTDVPALLIQGNAFLSTAIFEGQGLAALEAMSLRLPAVAMDCVGLRECIESGVDGHLVPLGDEKASASVLARVLVDGDEARRLGERGRHSVLTKYSSRAYALGFMDIANRTIEAHQVSPVPPGAAEFALGLLTEIAYAEEALRRRNAQPGLGARVSGMLKRRLGLG
jgi:glycosyltransferase involved in cell wall biosynthesis